MLPPNLVILKEEIKYGEFELAKEHRFRVVFVGQQNGHAFMWIELDTRTGPMSRAFRPVMTGEAYDGGVWEHAGSVTELEGKIVVHLLQERRLNVYVDDADGVTREKAVPARQVQEAIAETLRQRQEQERKWDKNKTR